MNRFLQGLNLTGVLILAVLLALQWRINSQVNARANDLEKTRIAQLQKLEEDDRTIKGQAADLEEFRQRLTLAESELKECESKLNQMTVERNRLASQRDQYKLALSKWMAAITDRDAAIKKAAIEIQDLAKQRNDVVLKLNDLVNKYNQLVKNGS